MVAPVIARAGALGGFRRVFRQRRREGQLFGVDVQADVRAIARDLRFVEGPLTRRVTRLALNQTGRWVERHAVAIIARKANIKKSHVRWRYQNPSGVPGRRKKDGRFLRGRVRSTKSKKRRLIYKTASDGLLVFSIDWVPRDMDKGPVVSWAAIGANQSKTGTQTTKGHQSKRAFIQETRSGNMQVFRRTGADRYPLDVMRVRFAAIADNAFERTIARSRPKFRAEFTRLMAVQLRKKAGHSVPTKAATRKQA